MLLVRASFGLVVTSLSTSTRKASLLVCKWVPPRSGLQFAPIPPPNLLQLSCHPNNLLHFPIEQPEVLDACAYPQMFWHILLVAVWAAQVDKPYFRINPVFVP
ncbi:hypothetical protein IE81DRAFT_326005 [Ceraceosorus guamensis]|uniref:Uncharacterized protein n=1 Tax=Ceraceosorus guamensis TaxID=1522189 RepID=A0A316VQS0_9BASI|nr:hypothetical protein IE81DRAFT_326005 [Ceraceosorus guamensis]PWN39957.1 hypothetical protein IE81DRAFT_326005 [Ceraceosorus guamensis]